MKNYFDFLNFLKRTPKVVIEEGDYIVPVRFNNLTEKQIDFLKSKEYFIADEVITKEDGDYVEIGFNIPLKANRFIKLDKTFEHKVLFLQFDIKIDTHDEPDVESLLKGCDRTPQLFTILVNEKIPNTRVDFYNYDSIYRLPDGFYCKNTKLDDYEFIFFGFMAKYTNIANLVVNYAAQHKIPHMKYETYDYFHNKAYQFDLLENLGYPYIPSVMTTKLTKNIKNGIEGFGFPLIVKDVYLDRGEGVFKMNDMEQLEKFFKNNVKLMLIQKFIPNDGEWRVISVKNKVQLIARKDSIEDVNKLNIDARKSKKGTLPQEIISMCEDISHHLFSDIVGFDIIQDLTDKKYYVIETNASPHFSMFSVVTNVSIPEKIVDYIISKMKKGN